MAFDLDPLYKQVPERIADFRAKHPDGCLRPVDPARPYWIETIDGQTFLVYAAAAYRSPNDPLPGIGMAWEPFPGRTPYTKLSELQNAETSAWGRAIVAVLASESKAVASAEDVRNRQADHQAPPPPPPPPTPDEMAKADGWDDVADWLAHKELYAHVFDDLDAGDQVGAGNALRAWRDAEGIMLPFSRANYVRVVDKAAEIIDSLQKATPAPRARRTPPAAPETAPAAPVTPPADPKVAKAQEELEAAVARRAQEPQRSALQDAINNPDEDPF